MTIHAARPWTCDSPAVALEDSAEFSGREDPRRRGCVYFLEVFIAIELLDDWEAGLPAPPSDRERCERLIELRTPRLRRGSDRPGLRPSP
ncbi:hypothetical protein [Planctomyces sp. SH-PL62]|uniref:hypothetical protein n=1 Tax=Planctomyces sp. SH-PL62 TaxID=1636152 RepID=UPI00078B4BD4|nr:hypothetical protein [Planctomyces sp. SH-PL62]AMV37686.1 hypothetical protein VT85_09635 [Planctomyces sp. SH-PL62]